MGSNGLSIGRPLACPRESDWVPTPGLKTQMNIGCQATRCPNVRLGAWSCLVWRDGVAPSRSSSMPYETACPAHQPLDQAHWKL
jgi:hypothetical protein